MEKIDYSTPQLVKMTDDVYFGTGVISYFNNKGLVTSASFYKDVFREDLYQILMKGKSLISEDLQYIFDVGSALHCFNLESKEFDKRYYSQEYKDALGEEHRDFIKTEDMDMIIGIYENIKIKYPEIHEESEFNEVVITCNFEGVPYRAKIDKIIEYEDYIEVIDLKSVFFSIYSGEYAKRGNDGIRYKLKRYLTDTGYDLQGYVYRKAVREYLESKGVNKEIRFSLLLCSKETLDVKKITFSPEMINSGREKFKLIFPEIKNFFDLGYEYVGKDEII